MSEKEFTVQSYLEFINSKELMGSKCKNCGELYAPPRRLCTKCNKADMEWVALSGKGKLAAFSCIGVGTKFMVDKGYSMIIFLVLWSSAKLKTRALACPKFVS